MNLKVQCQNILPADLENQLQQTKYSGMTKSERPKSGECQNPNECWFGFQTFGFRFVWFLDISPKLDRFIKKLYIKWSSLALTSKNRTFELGLSSSLQRPKFEQNHSVFGRFRNPNDFAPKLKSNVRNLNQFGFWHSTVLANVQSNFFDIYLTQISINTTRKIVNINKAK